MYLGQNIKQILPGNVAVGGANMGMVPLFSVQWCPSRNAIWAGYVAADGQELDNNLFPDAAAGIAANNVPTTSGSNWLADPAARGAYVAGSSAGKFRVPDYNGKFAGSLGAVFLRGDGTLSAAIAGVIQRDALQNITGGAFSYALSDGLYGAFAGATGSNYNWGGGGSLSRTGVDFDASRVARTAEETRPLNVTGCWVIKLFGAVTNMASADAAQLASSYASLGARIGQLEMTERLPLGFGQTWQDVTGSRVLGTNYTNTTGRSIQASVLVTTAGLGAFIRMVVGGTIIRQYIPAGLSSYFSVIIPSGATYSVPIEGVLTINSWQELR